MASHLHIQGPMLECTHDWFHGMRFFALKTWEGKSRVRYIPDRGTMRIDVVPISSQRKRRRYDLGLTSTRHVWLSELLRLYFVFIFICVWVVYWAQIFRPQSQHCYNILLTHVCLLFILWSFNANLKVFNLPVITFVNIFVCGYMYILVFQLLRYVWVRAVARQ